MITIRNKGEVNKERSMEKRKLTPFGMKVKKRLIEKEMTQVELAKLIGTSNKYINLIIHGERSGEKYLQRIANILEIDTE